MIDAIIIIFGMIVLGSLILAIIKPEIFLKPFRFIKTTPTKWKALGIWFVLAVIFGSIYRLTPPGQEMQRQEEEKARRDSIAREEKYMKEEIEKALDKINKQLQTEEE